MIVVEITERNRRKSSRVVFNDDTLAESFVDHARDRGARTRTLTPDEARAHVGGLRERAARRSDWRTGGAGIELAKRIAEARQRERSREISVTVALPRQVKSELDRLARLAGRTPDTVIRAAIVDFIKAARAREVAR